MNPLDSEERTRPMNWDGLHLPELLALEQIGSDHWRSRAGDSNANGRAYGGQLLGQAVMAALQGMPDARGPTMLQFLFLQGADPREPVDYEVQTLQEGKRFSSRRITARQSTGRTVLDAHLTCAVAMAAPCHEADPTAASEGERPEDAPTLDELPPALLENLVLLGGYDQDPKPSIEFRIPDAMAQLSPGTARPRLRYWIRTARPLPDEPVLRAAAFAYLTDWWLNFSALVPYFSSAATRSLYLSSLNHTIWMHRSVRPDEWLHVDSVSPASSGGRGLAVARVHDIAGRLVASVSQELLMTFVDPGPARA